MKSHADIDDGSIFFGYWNCYRCYYTLNYLNVENDDDGGGGEDEDCD